MTTATPVLRSSCHDRRSFYRACLPWQAPQAERALPRIPTLPAPRPLLVQEDSRQVAYFGPCFKRGDSAGAAKAADAALKECDKKKDDLHAGRKPRAETGDLTVKGDVQSIPARQGGSLRRGEVTPRSWQDYKDACDLLVSHLGKGRLVADLDPDEFAELRKKIARRWGRARWATSSTGWGPPPNSPRTMA